MGFFDTPMVNTLVNQFVQGGNGYASGRDGDVIISSKKDSVLLPVSPSYFSVTVSSDNDTVSLQGVGAVTLKGLTGVKSISFSSFFPGSAAYEYANMAQAPYDYIEKIEAIRNDASPCHLSIIGTNIDLDVVIDSLSYGEENGVGDVEYSLSFQEYRIPTQSIASTIRSSVGLRNRSSLATAFKRNIVVRRGDSLGSILKRAVLNTQAKDVRQEELDNLNTIKALVKQNRVPKVGESLARGLKKG